jgi:hypothetical protein
MTKVLDAGHWGMFGMDEHGSTYPDRGSLFRVRPAGDTRKQTPPQLTELIPPPNQLDSLSLVHFRSRPIGFNWQKPLTMPQNPLSGVIHQESAIFVDTDPTTLLPFLS